MPSINLNQVWEDDDNLYLGRPPRRKKSRRKQQVSTERAEELADMGEASENFNFTYNASRHEREWLLDSLANFHDTQWIEDVMRLIKGGKEASVYQCTSRILDERAETPYLAAKVYRPRRFRSLKNDYLYREGREDLDPDGNVIEDDGMLHAIRKRTAYGMQVLHTSWIEYEYQTLQALHAAGADVPQPFARGDNAILMAYIGGTEIPAPMLSSVTLEPVEARALYERLLNNIELMLENEVVHGDLSAYNILYWEGDLYLIDFPQVVSPYENRSAYNIFKRDIRRVCDYFSSQGVACRPKAIAEGLWRKYHYPRKPEIDLRTLDAENQADRDYWRKYGA